MSASISGRGKGKNMIRGRNGYTLVEILVVVIILAVLASMVVPRFLPQTEKAFVAEAAGILGAIRQGELAYRLDTGSYLDLTNASAATEWAKIGLDVPSTTKWSYAVTSGAGTATRAAGGGTYAGMTVTLATDGTWGGTHCNKPSN